MLVLKAAQDKVLATLKWVAEVVDRRHILPMKKGPLEDAFARFGGEPAVAKAAAAPAVPPRPVRDIRAAGFFKRGLARNSNSAFTGFFSAEKVNLRNAP